MIALLLSTLVLTTAAVPSIPEALQSNDALLAVFQHHNAELHLDFPAAEAPLRLRIFRDNLELIQEINEQDLGWTAGMNLFSTMTEEEKSQYAGRNSSLRAVPNTTPVLAAVSRAASSIDWRNSGAVTSVKNQQGNSCWTYSTTHCLEGVYQILTGRLKEFADQELMDCTYDGTGNSGNNGGFQNDAYDWLMAKKRIAPKSEYPSNGRDGICRSRGKSNALSGYRVTGYSRISRNEDGLINSLNIAPVSTNYQATRYNMAYSSGILYDRTCRSGFNDLNHAVTAVGYTSQYFIVKNSWGTTWGIRGYGHFKRNWHGCGLFQDNMQGRLRRTVLEEEE